MILHCVKASRNRIVGYCEEGEFRYFVFKTRLKSSIEAVDTASTPHGFAGQFRSGETTGLAMAMYPWLKGKPRKADAAYSDPRTSGILDAAVLASGRGQKAYPDEEVAESDPFVSRYGGSTMRISFGDIKGFAAIYEKVLGYGWVLEHIAECPPEKRESMRLAFKRGDAVWDIDD